MKIRITGVALGVMACLTCPAAAEENDHPRAYLGASIGGHLVLGDWAFGELDRISQPANAESSLISALRFGIDLSPAWAIEISGAHLPFDASDETNDGLDFAVRARWTFVEGGAAPFLMFGAGAYANPQPDPDGTPTEVRPQVHYGIGLGPQLGDHVRLRLDLRHMIAFGGGETGHNIAALGGFDILFGGSDAPEPAPEPPPKQEAPSDRDGDGIVDDSDDCSDAAEDIDGIQDDDGCPEDDADGDGIADPDDGCPLVAEDADGIQDTDGCPEDDTDSDGIADPDDGCPLESETVNGFEDDDGCPDTVPAPAEPPAAPAPRAEVTCATIDFDALVFFDLGRYTLRPEARPLLDEVARTMKTRPDVRRVQVLGFADTTGPADFNDRLSRQRAWTVRQALVARGVEKSRLTVLARGEQAPRASNETAEGRAQNRRVEFNILERDADASCPPQ